MNEVKQKFLIEQRDIHLRQIVAVNVAAVLAAVGAVAALFASSEKDLVTDDSDIVGAVILGVGVIPIFVGAAFFCHFHRTRIDLLTKEIVAASKEGGNESTSYDFAIYPTNHAMKVAFIGTLLLVTGALIIVFVPSISMNSAG